ncbi:MAG: pimeloyl-ACP methyl ester carboxylesterase [Bacteriovoracaceae bacterium]|jgi:pimeloyl-ACP methyl ester carboxylesterase
MEVKKYINKHSKLNLVFIPGGPGLSSISFDKLHPLKEKYSLFFLNPMGTTTKPNDVHDYDALLNEVKNSIKDMDNVVLCGHSFGGIQAIDIATNNYPNIKGLIVIGSPVSSKAFVSLGKRFESGITEKHTAISEKLENQPTDELYKEWFYIYRNFYFHPDNADQNIATITDDSVCVKSYTEAIAESATKEDRLYRLKSISIPKLFITGDADLVMSPKSAKDEANLGGFDLKIIKNAGHFAHYEQPQQTIETIDEFLSKGKIL